ncbi:MAG: PIN domain-containing protein [Candidatus Binatia bacterium]
MRWAIIDTGIYIGHWGRGLYAELLATTQQTFIVRHSAVVLSELRRGARTRSAEALVDSLHRLAAERWAPTENDWWEAGRLVRRLGDSRGWEVAKRREFQNDALIALTARRHGATIVTANRSDFEPLARTLRVAVLYA